MARFPHYRQLDQMSCGPTCLRIIARHFGKIVSVSQAEELAYQGRQGVNLLGLCTAAESIGLLSLPVQCHMSALLAERRVPFLAHWRQEHFVVVYAITSKRILVSDPAAPGLLSYSHGEFARHWISGTAQGEGFGTAVYFEPGPNFQKDDLAAGPATPASRGLAAILLGYLSGHSRLLIQLCIATGLGAMLLFAIPFLTQALVDQGVQLGDKKFVLIFLIAQICVSLGEVAAGFLRGWVLLYLSARISISLVTNFLATAMSLPLPFFDKRSMGDILQRLEDHQRVEQFLTAHVVDSMFAVLTLLVYGAVIISFSPAIFLVLLIGTALSVTWIMQFMRARLALNHRRFGELSESRGREIELIRGIADIKLTGSQTQKRWAWERVQVKLFKIRIANMGLEQTQNGGAVLINTVTRTVVLAMAADSVISGHLTLGAMLAMSAMMGQIGTSVSSFLYFIQNGQDAMVSLRRMTEISRAKPEDDEAQVYAEVAQGDIELRDISFRYGDKTAPFALAGIGLTITRGRTTAIVGSSGSGKTTLLKLLLKFYEPEQGEITVGGVQLSHLRARDWRAQCGAVMQDGFIFYDTIARNIAVSGEHIDRHRLVWAAEVAHASEFINALPLGFNTKVGGAGAGLSGGQRQRLLMARAVYAKPQLLILDEATSALDAHSEAVVSRNFAALTGGMTKLIVAHRLSTVRHADHIVVLEHGRVVERGSHDELAQARGRYFELVRNQLELGS